MMLVWLFFVLSSQAQVDIAGFPGEFVACQRPMTWFNPLQMICGPLPNKVSGYVRPDTPVRNVIVVLEDEKENTRRVDFPMPADCNTAACLKKLKAWLGPQFAGTEKIYLYGGYPIFSEPVDEEAGEDDPSYLSRIRGSNLRGQHIPFSLPCPTPPPVLSSTVVEDVTEGLWAKRAQLPEETQRKAFCVLKARYESAGRWDDLMRLISELPVENEDCLK